MAAPRIIDPYNLAASAYLGPIAARLFWRLWWLLLLPAACAAYGLAADWRWTVVGLILLLILYPMVMSLAVMRYATSARVLRRSGASRVSVSADGVATLLDAHGRVTESLPAPLYTATSGRYIMLQYSSAPDDILLLPR